MHEGNVMKKLSCLFIVLGCFSIIFSIQAYNTKILSQFNSIVIKEETTKLSILSPIDNEEQFLDDLKRIADEEEITLVQPYINTDEEYDLLLYIYGNDEEYKDNLLLCQGEIKDFRDFEIYSSDAEELDQRIFNLGASSSFALRPMKIDGTMIVDGSYRLVKEGNALSEEEKTNVYQKLSSFYPQLEIKIEDEEYHTVSSSNEYNNSRFKKNQVMLGLLDFLFVLIFSAELFKQFKSILRYKIEGYCSLELFWHFALKPILGSALLGSVFCFIGMRILAPFSYQKVAYFYQWTYKSYLSNLLLIVFLSVIYFIYISFVPLNTSMKGKSPLNITVYILKIMKIGLLGILILILPHGIKQTEAFLHSLIRDKAYTNTLKNVYQLNGFNSQSNFFQDGLADYSNPVYLHLVNENQAFRFENEVNPLYEDYYDKNEYCYQVDENYLRQNGLIDENTDLDKPIILFRKNNEKRIKQADGAINNLLSEKEREQAEIKEIDRQLTSWSNLYFYDDAIVKGVLVYKGNEELKYNQYYHLKFYYEGSLEEAQQYVDELFEKNGYDKSYEVISLLDEYEAFKEIEYRTKWQEVMETIIAYLSYFILFLRLTKLDSINHQKRYFIEKIEGYTISPRYVENMMEACGNVLFYLVGCIVYYHKMDEGIILSTLFLLVIETGLALLYHGYLHSAERKETL